MKQFPNIEQFAKCPSCGKKYNPAKALILRDEGEKAILHLTCAVCQMSTLVFISWGKFGMVSFGMATDLEQGEVKKFFQRKVVSQNQVIDTYRFLKNFKGKAVDFI